MPRRLIPTLLERPTARKIAIGVGLLAVAWHVVALGRIFCARFPCPLDLEYLESAHVYHAWRLAHGLPLYADPARGFATFPYPPLYWLAIEWAAALLGFTDQAGRAVSIASLLVAMAILGWQVARAAPSRRVGAAFVAIAVAGICAGYPACDGSYDWVRSDTMAMAFTILAAAIARDGLMPPLRALATGVALALSIYTKQSGTVFAIWLIAFALWRDRAGGLRLAAVVALSCAAPFAVLEAKTGGWFLVWLLYPGHQPLHSWWGVFGAPMALVRRAPFLPFLLWLVPALSKRGWLRQTTALWAGLLLVAVVGSSLLSVKYFTVGNIWIPGLLLSWPVGLMLAGDWLSGSRQHEAARTPAVTAGVLALASALLVLLVYDTSPFVPNADWWRAAERLDGITRGLDGGVVVATDPMVGIRAGGPVEQPILATYEDARSAGMQTDYVAALVTSGARWVVTTDRYSGTEHAPEPRMARYFTRERTYDFDVHSLATWDRPKNVVLWQRAPQ